MHVFNGKTYGGRSSSSNCFGGHGIRSSCTGVGNCRYDGDEL